ncbi:uncharacterized protein BN512_00321 [Clostridium sp. CAG:167]|jgi:hypothetical protein|nr:uncharacterized protein BN512_00321 [Clostridium sp. CAG:167]
MNKKEVAEIKKRFTKTKCSFTRLCGCYVDAEKQKRLTLKEAFLSLPEEEMFKYIDIFRKTLSGSIGKTMLNMEFPMEQETKEDGTQRFLMKLLESKLTDDDLLNEFYDKIISVYNYPENYFIILTHDAYDIPKITSDGVENFDASEYVYDYILCCICPVKLTKPGLCYNAETNHIQDRIRDWVVEAPQSGFLFPAFNDRNMDIHNLLYYSKKSDELDAVITEEVLGCQLPLPAKSQKETFNNILEESLGLDCDYEVVKTIHENLNQMLAETSEEPEPLALAKEDMSHLLMKSGVEEKEIETFETRFDETVGEDQCLMAANISSPKKFEVATPDVKVTVNPQRTDLVETKIIDGVPYLMIEINDLVEVNGIQVVSELASSGSSENSGETAAE